MSGEVQSDSSPLHVTNIHMQSQPQIILRQDPPNDQPIITDIDIQSRYYIDSLFIIVIEKGIDLPSSDWFNHQFKEVYNYVSEKLDSELKEEIRVVLRYPTANDEGEIRGTAGNDIIQIFIRPQTSQDQILAVFAHELSHLLLYKWVPQNNPHRMLNEGLATWLAGKYWLQWHQIPSFNLAAREHINRNKYIKLDTSYVLIFKSVEYRDILYSEWASFMDYLVKIYGFEKCKILYSCSPVRGRRLFDPENFDLENLNINDPLTDASCFEKTYGMTLKELEKQWLMYLDNISEQDRTE